MFPRWRSCWRRYQSANCIITYADAILLKVSVIVVNWNRRELLRACLKSLETQTQQNFEIIVVDNGSADGSAEMLGSDYSAGRLIRNPEKLGFCAAHNQGIQGSQAEFCAPLNTHADG